VGPQRSPTHVHTCERTHGLLPLPPLGCSVLIEIVQRLCVLPASASWTAFSLLLGLVLSPQTAPLRPGPSWPRCLCILQGIWWGTEPSRGPVLPSLEDPHVSPTSQEPAWSLHLHQLMSQTSRMVWENWPQGFKWEQCIKSAVCVLGSSRGWANIFDLG
jgi:hypothetical protein